MGLLAVPLSIGTMLVADQLAVALFGEAFSASGLMLVILMTLPLIGFLNMTLGQGLTARGLAGRVAVVAIAAAAINVALNLILVPAFGGVGAAVAVTVTEVCTAVPYLWMLWRSDRIFPVPAYLACVPATLVMAACIIIIRASTSVPLPVVVVAGIGAFLGGSIVFPSRGLTLIMGFMPRLPGAGPRPSR
jgi:O-antigen/teichoic acid export membrane protein